MTSFTDNRNLSWDTDLTLGKVRFIDKVDFSQVTEMKFSLLKPEDKTLMTILEEPALLFAVIWYLNRNKAIQYYKEEMIPFSPEVNPKEAEEDFIEHINGEQIESAKLALWEGFESFFPQQRTFLSTGRKQYLNALSRINKTADKMIPLLEKKINLEIDQAIEEVENRVNQELLGESSLGILVAQDTPSET